MKLMKIRLRGTLLALLAGLLCCLNMNGAETLTKSAEPLPLRFAWGANLDGSIELSGHNMSCIGIDGEFGLSWRWVRFFGVSAQADIMIGSSSRSYPLTAVFRTDFCSHERRLLFMEVRGGVDLCYLEGYNNDTQPYGSAGLGVTLAHGKNFSTHVILAYTYVGRDKCTSGTHERNCPGMSYATLRFGVSF